jgi:hypothetical protein
MSGGRFVIEKRYTRDYRVPLSDDDMRACLETQKLEQLEARVEEVARSRVAARERAIAREKTVYADATEQPDEWTNETEHRPN